MSAAVSARIINEPKRGLLRAGSIADLILLDDHANHFAVAFRASLHLAITWGV